MPKQTFLNLDKQKKQTLIDALQKEFSRVSVQEASVANIVKFAQIPRGSFYQYFHDKEDAFLYLLSLYGKENKKWFVRQLKKTEGDLFASSSFMFKRMIEQLVTGDHYHFFRNAFLNMNHKMEKAITRNIKLEETIKEIEDFADWIDNGRLAINDQQDLYHVFNILSALTFQNIIHAFAKQLTAEDACRSFEIEINMIKNGLLKKENS